ncbi:hypothetical protein CGCSCA1_v009082 [Colletotrichum siamense]|nr:hypothetical protein CGCSCA1_v009082 [Colletotrichum siamense]
MHAMPRFAGLSNSDTTPHTRADFQTGGEVKKFGVLGGNGTQDPRKLGVFSDGRFFGGGLPGR